MYDGMFVTMSHDPVGTVITRAGELDRRIGAMLR